MCDCYKRLIKENIHTKNILYELNKLYSSKHFDITAEGTRPWQKYMGYVLSHVNLDGYWLEFGVWAGRTIKYIANQANGVVYGFDSFEGLQEDWGNLEKGRFNRNGKIPVDLPDNIDIIDGYFEDTLPKFIQNTMGVGESWFDKKSICSFIHIDSDLYSSAKTILNTLKDKIISGTVIAFDDFHNWKCCLEGEFKALMESDLNYEYIAHTNHVQGAIIIT